MAQGLGLRRRVPRAEYPWVSYPETVEREPSDGRA